MLSFCFVLFSLDRKNGADFPAVDLDGLGVDQDECGDRRDGAAVDPGVHGATLDDDVAGLQMDDLATLSSSRSIAPDSTIA
jgi:hypothetical protein